MQPAAAPREIGVDWSEVTRETREPKYRFGVFLADGSHHPQLPIFPGPNLARHMAGDGEHVRRGVVVGESSHGRDRIEWEGVACLE